MSTDTRGWILTITAFVLAVLVLLASTAQAKSDNAAEVCPEQGKVESVVDGDLDDIVLEAGTEVCIKGSTTLVTVTADGVSTLRQLLGINKDVSHYTIIKEPSSTTTTTPETTTTQPSTTTSTTEKVTQTTEASTTTTIQEASSSTTTVSSPTTTEPSSSPATLPFTGPENLLVLSLLGAASLGLGLRLIRREAQ